MKGCHWYIVQTPTDDMWWIDHGSIVICAPPDTLTQWLIPIQLYVQWCHKSWSGCVLSLVNLNLRKPQSPEVDPISKDHPRSWGKWWCLIFYCWYSWFVLRIFYLYVTVFKIRRACSGVLISFRQKHLSYFSSCCHHSVTAYYNFRTKKEKKKKKEETTQTVMSKVADTGWPAAVCEFPQCDPSNQNIPQTSPD